MKHVEMIESVQRHAKKELPGLEDLTYPDRVKKLELSSLSYRRVRRDKTDM